MVKVVKKLKMWQERYRQLISTLSGRGKTTGFDWLIRQYHQPRRHYHTFTHIQDCLCLLDEFRGYFQEPATCEFALWTHDIIYRPYATDNEERSAAWAKAVLKDVGAPNKTQYRVYQLVLCTKHHYSAADLDSQLLIDIDLSILGSSPGDFQTYDTLIRKEYRWVPIKTYIAKRALVLTSFLRRPHIFQTQPLRQRFESQARRNIGNWLTLHGQTGQSDF